MHKSSSMLGRAYGLGSCMLIPKKYLEPLSLVLGDISLHHVNKVCNIQQMGEHRFYQILTLFNC